MWWWCAAAAMAAEPEPVRQAWGVADLVHPIHAIPLDARRHVFVLDASCSQGPDGWAHQRQQLAAWVETLGEGQAAVVAYDAAAEWLVKPWAPLADVMAAVPEAFPARHGSEVGYAAGFAMLTEPPPHEVWVWTDGLLATVPAASDVLVQLTAAEPGALPRTHVLYTDPRSDGAGGDEAAAAAWLQTQVDAAVVVCVPKERHRRALPGTLRVETTWTEIVGLDLGSTDDRWRYCLAEHMSRLVLGAPFDAIPHLEATPALRPASG